MHEYAVLPGPNPELEPLPLRKEADALLNDGPLNLAQRNKHLLIKVLTYVLHFTGWVA
jgi:hypothetical protein